MLRFFLRVELSLWLLTVGLLCSCGSKHRALQFNLGTEAVQLDWNLANDMQSVILLDNIMAGLTGYSSALEGGSENNLRPMHVLAKSWTVSDHGQTYVFRIREDVKWTDGVPLSAHQFVDSWERLLSPRLRATTAYQFFDIENAQEYFSGKITDFGKVGVKALDPFTLEVKLKRQAPYFLHLMASSNSFPIRKDLIEKFGQDWTDSETLVTLGPYRITEWSRGESIVLERNDRYFEKITGVDKVICRLVPEPLTALAMYENGLLDIIPRDLPVSMGAGLLEHDGYHTAPKLSVTYLIFNLHRPPFDSVNNRREFIQAQNRAELASLFNGAQTPTSTWIPPGLPGFDPSLGIKAAGVPSTSFKGKNIEIRYSGSDVWNLVFQNLQKNIEEKLQMRTKLNQWEWGEYQGFLAQLTGLGRGRKMEQMPHLFFLSWVADYPDPYNFMNVFTSKSENNLTGWSNPKYDSLVENAAATDSLTNRRQLYAEAQKILLEDDVVIMPLFVTSHQALVRPDLIDVKLNSIDKWYFQHFKFKNKDFTQVFSSWFRENWPWKKKSLSKIKDNS